MDGYRMDGDGYRLNINDIFESISGEAGGFPQGSWCLFIRLQGCNLRCKWCDTEQSQRVRKIGGGNEGTIMSVPEIVEKCQGYDRILITGGEPLCQARSLAVLVKALLKQGKQIQIETNGSIEIPIFEIPPEYFTVFLSPILPIFWVMDYKCPSSGMSGRMPSMESLSRQIENAHRQGDLVYLKWVVADKEDMEFALDGIKQLTYLYHNPVQHLISPIHGEGAKIGEVIERIKQENDPKLFNRIIFSVQLHKLFNLP